MKRKLILYSLFYFLSLNLSAQDNSTYGEKIKFSLALNNTKIVKNIKKAIKNPEEVICLELIIRKDKNELNLFKQNYHKFNNLRKLVIINSPASKTISLDLNFNYFDSLEYLGIQGLLLSPELKGIENLTKLKHLSLCSVWFNAIPTSICKINSLEVLDLAINYIPFIPDEISKLNNLKELIISNNCFKEIPEIIGELKSLIILNYNNVETPGYYPDGESVCSNTLVSLPDFIFLMPKLEVVSLYKVERSEEIQNKIREKGSKLIFD
ncbi:MAG: leucine-rich repeat domain-containing protein [Flavobacteriia bacterium]|jgi:Leucine-rich repeat (LRR) protein